MSGPKLRLESPIGLRPRNRSLRPALGAMTLAAVIGLGVVPERAVGETIIWGANRTRNASFEDLYDHWNIRMGARQEGELVEAAVDVDASQAKTGVHSLKFSGDARTTKWWAIESDPITVTPGKRYKFSTWLKTEDVKVEAGQYRNCNAYIQFRDAQGQIVNLGNSPVRGTQPLMDTHDWVEAFAVVVAPEGATEARVGCTLTCSGTAWFDDVGFYESTDYAWARKRTNRFAFMYTQGDVPTDAILEETEAYLQKLEDVIGVSYPYPIVYYKYKSIDQKEEIMGRASESHVDGNALHTIKWDERQDLVHVIMREVGPSILVFAEGLALYATAAVDGRDVHAAARDLLKRGALAPISTFVDPSVVNLAPRPVMEAEFGSFVGYLIQRFGMPKFRTLYPFESRKEAAEKLPERFEAVYGISFEQGQRDWIEFLQSGKQQPEKDESDE